MLFYDSSDSSVDDNISNDDDSSAPEQSEVDASDQEEDRQVSYADGEDKKKDDRSVKLQVIPLTSTRNNPCRSELFFEKKFNSLTAEISWKAI